MKREKEKGNFRLLFFHPRDYKALSEANEADYRAVSETLHLKGSSNTPSGN